LQFTGDCNRKTLFKPSQGVWNARSHEKTRPELDHEGSAGHYYRCLCFLFRFYWQESAKRTSLPLLTAKPSAYVDLQKEHQNLSQFYRKRLGGMLTDEMLKGLNLKQQALDNLIQQAIILQKG